MTPRLARVLVVAGAAVAVLVAGLTQEEAQTAASEPIVVRYVYTSDASDELLEALVRRFNDESHAHDGREITVLGIEKNSGTAADEISPRLPAALWTPASSLWGSLLNHRAGENWAPKSPSLVYSTQVIVMWRQLAVALGWPEKSIRWRDILAMRESPNFWKQHGLRHGAFLLGHSNPRFSTSGLSAVVSAYYAVTGKSDLTLEDVRTPEVRAQVRELERSIVRYADTVDDLTERMGKFQIPYAHAVYAQKTNLFKFHEKWPRSKKLVSIVPADGTFVADYPAIALDVPWLSPAERAAALAFRRWLLPQIRPALAANNEAGFQISRPKGLVELKPPPPAVLAEIREAWHDDRKPSNIVLVVDTSDSMAQAGRLDAAKPALLSFLDGLSPEDRVALLPSHDGASGRVQLVTPVNSRLPKSVRELDGAGEEPVYPAITRALRRLRGLNQTERINAIVVLADGSGPVAGRIELMQAIDQFHETEGLNVRIFTIAYGPDAHRKPLREIADASDGEFYPGAPRNIETVYDEISANF